ncbi:F-box domain-containing protein [Colletotrichum kahawae]|uniref:F-box domain-containing protein n=1 Tax=Colletotrichum kahawae TaxID=34407 RepID=A0AAE0DDG1_COLKA|nr:F-box domain-containing protein [Colletotrichum kahawae]
MELNDFPTEVLSLVLQSLFEDKNKYSQFTWGYHEIANARLVCRKWNTLMTSHVFETIALVHHDAPEADFDGDEDEDAEEAADRSEFRIWNKMLDNDTIRNLAQCAIIRSAPEDLTNDGDYEIWRDWKNKGEYPRFTNAVARITELKNLRMLHLRFSDKCRGDTQRSTRWDDGWDDGVEPQATRFATLRTVFNAMATRARDPDATKIRWLRLENVQNTSLESLVAPGVADVVKDITRLDLLVLEEWNEHGPDHDFHLKERRLFEPHLQKEILPNFSDSLTTLTLGFQEYWGTAPGYFDGKGLKFPHLKTLNLINFVISHHDHFDWVLAQTSLTTLRLFNCRIASHLRLFDDLLAISSTPTHDWERCPHGAFGFTHNEDRVYTFSGRWETIFYSIHTKLTNLTNFCFDSVRRMDAPFRQLEDIKNCLFPNRYIVLDAGLLPSPWLEPSEFDGSMEFGNNDPTPVAPESTDNGYDSDCELNVGKDLSKYDFRAFDSLIRATWNRSHGWDWWSSRCSPPITRPIEKPRAVHFVFGEGWVPVSSNS